ncbi:MAG: hypothetical protein KDA67_09265 [Rhodobacteraceae bacterium]|nr:hypothetical protein [Paracoccaceae bacterium]
MAGFRDRLNSPGILPFAHRGDNGTLPENSMAAFQAAVDLGFDLLETDIRTSRDGVPYCYHDENLLRLTGEDRLFQDMTSGDLDHLKLANGQGIPRLDAVIEAFPAASFNLDAKSEAVCQPLGRLIARMKIADRICVGSFSDKRIRRVVCAAGQDLCTSLGTSEVLRFYLGARTGLRQQFAAGCVQLPTRYRGVPLVTRQTIDHAHRTGLKLHVWTINDRAGINHLLDLGVDGIMSDDCRMLKLALTERGIWPAG